jgi:hypothetical protein
LCATFARLPSSPHTLLSQHSSSRTSGSTRHWRLLYVRHWSLCNLSRGRIRQISIQMHIPPPFCCMPGPPGARYPTTRTLDQTSSHLLPPHPQWSPRTRDIHCATLLLSRQSFQASFDTSSTQTHLCCSLLLEPFLVTQCSSNTTKNLPPNRAISCPRRHSHIPNRFPANDTPQ